MKAVVLMEDTLGDPRFCAQHGLSIFIETGNHRILLDTGPGEALLKNARAASVDLSSVDLAVLTHGHYDHSGGILAFSEVNPIAPIYIQKSAQGDYYNAAPGKERYIGMDKRISSLNQVRFLEGDYRLDEGLFLFTGVKGRRMFSKSNKNLKILSGNALISDDFRHEQYLVVEEKGKTFLFSGCAHNGILNILDRFREIYGSDPDHVISGFHFMRQPRYTEEEVGIFRETAGELTKMHTLFHTGHCTGIESYLEMKEILGDQISLFHCGDVLDLR